MYPPGIPELREAIVEHLSTSRKINVSPDEVVVTPGAKPILFLSMLACVNPGDEVMYPNPGFPIYESMINFVDAKPVPIHLVEEAGFTLDPEEIQRKITPNTSMIILNSPQNPTGGVLNQADLGTIADAVRHRDDVVVLSDRNLQRDKVRREASPEHRFSARDEGENHRSGWFLKGICYDRLANRICRNAKRASTPDDQVDNKLSLLHRGVLLRLQRLKR